MRSLNQPFHTPYPKRHYLPLLPFFLSASLLGLSIFWLHTTPPLRGQGEEQWDAPTVTVNATTFPTITVSFICRGAHLTVDDFFFYEDLKRLTPRALSTEVATPPTQVAIVLDLYRSRDATTMRKTAELISKAGDNNDLVDGIVALRGERPENKIFSVTQDSLAIVIPHQDNSAVPQSILTLTLPSTPTVEISKPLTFTYDLNSLINRLNIAEFSEALPGIRADETTKLRDLLLGVIAGFEQTPGQRRSLLLFSNGADLASTATVTNVVEAANKRHIAIYTIYVDTTLPGDQAQLRFLADKTGGDFITTTVAIGAVLTGTLYQPAQRCHLVYRTSNPQPENVIILPKGPLAVAATVAITLPELRITPPLITITQPARSAIITREEPLYLSNIVQWDLGVYANRRVLSVTYALKGPIDVRYQRIFPITPQWPYSWYKYFIPKTDLVSGNYLVKVTVVDELGLVGVNEQPFAIRITPPLPPPAKETGPSSTWWTELRQWLAALQAYFLQARLPLPQVTLWSIVAAVLVGLLLLWLFRKQRYAPFQEGELILPPRYSAALIRVRMDSGAPPLLHMAPLGHRGEVDIPDYLYHPIGKNYPTNGQHLEFSQWYQAKIKVAGDSFTIERDPNIDPKSATIAHREPIKILVAETAQAFTLIDDGTLTKRLEFGPLYDGDIIQLGDTHYKFIRIVPDEKNNPDAGSAGNGKTTWGTSAALRQRWYALRWPAWFQKMRSKQAQPVQPASMTGANETGKNEAAANDVAKNEIGKNE